MSAIKRVEVAAAVIRRADGQILLGQRAADAVYAGFWEFPGGKVEAGEAPRAALLRELKEELDIEVTSATPWITRDYDYEHARVRLYFFEVSGWVGEPRAKVHAALAWQRPDAPSVSPMLPANAPVLKALHLPRVYAITQAWSMGVAAQLAALERALAAGVGLVQLREGELDAPIRRTLAEAVRSRTREAGTLMLVNGDEELARAVGADGLHLPTTRLMALKTRPDLPWVGASCHSREELMQAARIGADFALLGPVAATQSHPGMPGMGWDELARLLEACPLPVFAIGGLSAADLPRAQQAGAHGIAGIRGVWPA
jgi:8-oxo-dGTP diphosphatase